ncbi:MAG TPA: serine/threonine-protein kinase [Iamia sp.]|nr:serine/threonine-protein kinase [Iamia sp.]
MAEPGTMPRVLLDRYELRDQVGVGGMGEVWLGWDRRLQRDVAVKLLLPQLSDEPAFRQRFEVEARAAAALEHPNVVRVFDIDDDDGSLFIVMERLPGPSLDRRIYEEGALPEDEVVRIAADMLSGLAAAHAENLVHRDIKPGNLIKAAGGRWKVGDFGVAKDLASTAHLTLVGVAVGTPAYLAPEQLDGRPATPATDLWAAGVVLREALTGRRPFEGNDPIEVAHAVQSTIVPPLASVRPDLSPALAAAIDRSLSFDPRQRFATAQDMLDAIEGKGPAAIPLPPVEAVPAPPPSVSGEIAPLPPPEAVPSGPVPSGEVPAAAPPAGDGSGLRVVAIVAAVVGLLVVLLFLLALLLGLVMLGDDDGGDEPPPPSSTTAEPAPTADDEAPAEEPSTSVPGDDPDDDPDGLLPGDGPVEDLPPTTAEPEPEPGSEPESELPGSTVPSTVTPGPGELEPEAAPGAAFGR